MQLGEVGVWTSYRAIGEENAGEAAKFVEDLGYGTLWLGGSPRLPTVRPLLDATERLIVATGIVNVWQYEPSELATECAQLACEFPGRLLLGIGIGHPEATGEYSDPLSTMRDFFDGLDSAAVPVPRDARCAAALGPKMLDLSAQRSLGTLTYFVPVEHTRFARERIGEHALANRAGVRGRDGRRSGPCESAQLRQPLPRTAQLHEQLAPVRLHRRGHHPGRL